MNAGRFDRTALPSALDYFAQIGNPLRGRGAWRDAICPFHDDSRPSLRVHAQTGAFRCMVCGARGGDVLQFERLRANCNFIEAAHRLGAWA
jgi:DNA primase